MIDIVWREGQPNTAVRVKGFWHRQLMMFKLGFQMTNPHRVIRLQSPSPYLGWLSTDEPSDIARWVERYQLKR